MDLDRHTTLLTSVEEQKTILKFVNVTSDLLNSFKYDYSIRREIEKAGHRDTISNLIKDCDRIKNMIN